MTGHRSEYPMTWRAIDILVVEDKDYIFPSTTHLEITSVLPANAPLPITRTGYRSHFLVDDILQDAGGALAYVITWLDREALSPSWQRDQTRSQQPSLFAEPS